MNPQIETALAFILFLPVFAILGALYCLFPRRPGGAARRLADLLVLGVAAVLSVAAMRWGYAAAASGHDRIWPQIIATLLAYGAFLAILCVAVPLRARWLRRR